MPKQRNTTEIRLLTNDIKTLDSFISNNLNTNLGKGILIGSYWLEARINECFNRLEKIDNSLLVNYI